MKRINNILQGTATLLAVFVIVAGVAFATPFTAMADGTFVWPSSNGVTTTYAPKPATVSWPTSSGITTTYSSKPATIYSTPTVRPATIYTTPTVRPATIYTTPTYKTNFAFYPNTYYNQPSLYTYRTDFSYYPVGSYGGGSNYNNNVNNNNVNVNVNGGNGNHSCAEFGQSGSYPNCYIPHNPSCADYGQTGSYPNCHTTTHRSVSCDLTASDTRVSEGDRITLEWDTSGNPDYASINQGIGRVDEDGGSERVTVDNDTTFRMTVRNSDGDEDTCSVTVRVDDNNFSSVAFTGEPVNNPPVVYLSSIPYTGLEDIDPILLTYWFMLIAAAAGGVWFLYTKGMIPTFAFASVADGEVDGDVAPEATTEVLPGVDEFLSALRDGETDVALEHIRTAAASGTGVEEFLASAESVATDAELQARVSSALAESRMTGIRGAKAVLTA